MCLRRRGGTGAKGEEMAEARFLVGGVSKRASVASHHRACKEGATVANYTAIAVSEASEMTKR